MTNHFILATINGCKLQIVDQTEFPEKSSIQEYSFEDSVSINILINNKTKEDEIINQEILVHNDPKLVSKQYNYMATEDAYSTEIDSNYLSLESTDISEFQLFNDGKYTAYHMIIPTKQWVDKYDSDTLLQNYAYLYYYDSGNIYKSLDGGKTSEITSADLIKEVNITGSTLYRCKKETFSICFLYQCYINYCKRILDQTINKCITKDEDLLFKRDFVWMTINIIKYYLENGQLDEAQRLLEETMSCNGFCKSNILKYSLTNNTVSGCGCGN